MRGWYPRTEDTTFAAEIRMTGRGVPASREALGCGSGFEFRSRFQTEASIPTAASLILPGSRGGS